MIFKLDILMLVLVGSLSAILVSDVNAQSESELAQTIAQFIDGNPACEFPTLQGTEILFNTCAHIIYESPSKVVLTGDFIHTLSQTHNAVIWEIIEMQETKGFSVELIELTGQGTKGNPHSYFIVMSSSTK